MVANDSKGVTDVVVEGFLVIFAAEEVVSIWVHEVVATSVAGVFCDAVGHNREAEFALKENGEVSVRESVVFFLAVVEVEGDRGVEAEDGWKGNEVNGGQSVWQAPVVGRRSEHRSVVKWAAGEHLE